MSEIDLLPILVTQTGKYQLRNGGYAIVHEIRPGTSTFEVKGNFYDPDRKYSKNHPGHFDIWHVSGRHSVLEKKSRDLVKFIG